jgi:hypothetical protein
VGWKRCSGSRFGGWEKGGEEEWRPTSAFGCPASFLHDEAEAEAFGSVTETKGGKEKKGKTKGEKASP